MEVERIRATVPTLPWARNHGTPLQPGDSLQLRLDGTLADDLLATTPDGGSLRLAGLAHLGRGLSPGDILLARIVATTPSLELELLSPRSSGRSAQGETSADPAAMRFDQAALRRAVVRLPDPILLAAAWHQTLLRAATAPQRPPLPSPRNPPPSVSDLFTEEPLLPPPTAPTDRWVLPVVAWGGMPAALLLLPYEEDTTPPPRRRSTAGALRLELDLPELGRVGVEVRQLAGGIGLVLYVPSAEAARAVRESIPAIAAALARAELAVVKLGLEHGRPPGREATGATLPVPAECAAALHPGLFRAVAEVAVVLLGRTLGGA